MFRYNVNNGLPSFYQPSISNADKQLDQHDKARKQKIKHHADNKRHAKYFPDFHPGEQVLVKDLRQHQIETILVSNTIHHHQSYPASVKVAHRFDRYYIRHKSHIKLYRQSSASSPSSTRRQPPSRVFTDNASADMILLEPDVQEEEEEVDDDVESIYESTTGSFSNSEVSDSASSENETVLHNITTDQWNEIENNTQKEKLKDPTN